MREVRNLGEIQGSNFSSIAGFGINRARFSMEIFPPASQRRIVAIPTPERFAKSSCRTLVAKRNSLKRLAIASSCSTGVSNRNLL
jgi:hypothetical protein